MGETGWLLPIGEVDAMADAAHRDSCGDKERWRAMSAAAAADARARFAIDDIVSQYEALYRDV